MNGLIAESRPKDGGVRDGGNAASTRLSGGLQKSSRLRVIPVIDRQTAFARKSCNRWMMLLVPVATLILVMGCLSGICILCFPDDQCILSTPCASHETIAVSGDAEFSSLAALEGWDGDGSDGNPFVIQDLEIDGGGLDHAIYIEDTRVHFVIFNCTAWNAHYGIEIHNVTNCTILSNSMFELTIGIATTNSPGPITIAWNNCSSNEMHGIYVMYSDGILVANNTCIADSSIGIFEFSCNNLRVIDNHCTGCNYGVSTESDAVQLVGNNLSGNYQGARIYGDLTNLTDNICRSNSIGAVFDGVVEATVVGNDFSAAESLGAGFLSCTGPIVIRDNEFNRSGWICGLQLASTSDCTLSGNVFVGCGLQITSTGVSGWNSHTIDTTNTVNSLPLRYYKDTTGGAVPVGSGQVILANCNNMHVENQTISETNCGITLGFSSYNIITHNNISDCSRYGVAIQNSAWNLLTNNTIWHSDYSGLWLDGYPTLPFTANNMITGNWFRFNTWYGVQIDRAYNNTIYANVFEGNNGATSVYNPDHTQADDDGFNNNHWDFNGIGNYWSDWTSPDENEDGIVDFPYVFHGLDAQDDYPLASAPIVIPEFSSSLSVAGMIMMMTLIYFRRHASRRQ